MLLIAILWVVLGVFICYKRNWYKHLNSDDDLTPVLAVVISILLTPVNFLIVFFKLFFLNKWEL